MKLAGLSVACGGWEMCAPDYVVQRDTFEFQCVEFVVSGRGELRLNGTAHPLRPGVAFSYARGIRHEIRTSGDEPLEKYFVDFSGRDAPAAMRDCGISLGRAIQVSAIGDVRSGFDALIALGLRRDARTERTCGLQLELLLHTIARSGAPHSVPERRARAAFERCRHYIDTHFLQLQSLADVTRACHVEASHLCRLFKRFHHEPPLRYLQQRRMHWAAERLQDSDVLVRELAEALKLDAFHFSRMFKRVHGVSPLGLLAARG